MAREKRALILVAVAALVAALAVCAWPSGTSLDEGAATAKTPTLSGAMANQSPDIGDIDQDESGPPDGADDGWREVVLGFASDLASHDGDHAAWHRRLSRWVTPALAESYQHADPRLLPREGTTRVLASNEALGVVEAVLVQEEGTILVVRLERSQADPSWSVTSAAPGLWVVSD